MANTEKKNLFKDLGISVVLSLITFSVLFYTDRATIVLDSMETFNSTITTLLGLLFAILALLYTFEAQFRDSKAVQILRKNDQFIDIIRIFYYTVGVLGLVWVYTFTLAIFGFHSELGEVSQLIISFGLILGFFAVLIRLWRCYWIFVRLNRAVREFS